MGPLLCILKHEYSHRSYVPSYIKISPKGEAYITTMRDDIKRDKT